MNNSFTKTLLRYFFQGLLILAPIGITVYLIVVMVRKIGSWMDLFGLTFNPLIDPLIGFIAAMVIIVLIGMIGSSIVARPTLLMIERLVEKAPLIKTIYSSVKDLLSAFVGNKRRFNKPVMVLTNRENGISKLGFITTEDLSHLGIKSDKVAVYLPYSYAFSGMLLIVPAENVTPVSASAADVMKFIISGGVTEID
jgi:uncharacterized membrane protein